MELQAGQSEGEKAECFPPGAFLPLDSEVSLPVTPEPLPMAFALRQLLRGSDDVDNAAAGE